VRLQLHALAYNLGNFLRALATPEPIKDWSLTSLKKKLIKIGAKVVSHGRFVAFQRAEVAIPRNLFADILRLVAELRPAPATSTGQCVRLSLAAKRIYKPPRGLNDISVLSKSYYVRSLSRDKAVIWRMSEDLANRLFLGLMLTEPPHRR
jgi:hypothetical protein